MRPDRNRPITGIGHDQLRCQAAIECHNVAFTENDFTGNHSSGLSRNLPGITTPSLSFCDFLLGFRSLFHRFTHLKKAKVEVKVERRSTSCFLSLALNLNLPI